MAIRQAPSYGYNRNAAAQNVFHGIKPPAVPGVDLRSITATGDVLQTQQAVDATLRHDSSLRGYMVAVDALGRANASPDVLGPYRAQAQRLAFQQVQSGAAEPLPWIAAAGFALQDQNQDLLRATTNQLLNRFPEDPHGHYFAGVQAIEEGDWESAEKSLRRAEALGMPSHSIAQMLKLAIDRQLWVWQYSIIIASVAVAWFLGLLVIYLLGVLLSRATLRAAQRDDPTATNAREHQLRWLYSKVIDLAGFYYYFSLPVLLVLSIALPLSLAYAALMLPYLNLWIVAVFLIGGVTGVITALSGIRTAFVRTQDQIGGRELRQQDAPAFWDLLGEVAKNVGGRTVDEVWLTPQTDMAVTERGGWVARLTGKERRVLIMGVGLLPGFRVDALKAVLAHEYAHFLHGDTAGGEVAMRVRIAMLRQAEAIAKRGVIRSWDIAIWYLKFYFRMFSRLTYGARRLQEVLADRRAVEVYGGAAFIAGLGHVVRRSIEFETLLSEAVASSVRSSNPSVAFYSPAKALSREQKESIADQVRNVYQLPESPDDTHPSLSKRYAAARRVGFDRQVGPDVVAPLLGKSASRIAKEMLASLNASVEREAAVARRQDEVALEQVEANIDRDPTWEMVEARAVLYYRAGEYERAVDDLDLLLEIMPNELGVLLSRSNLHEVLKHDNLMAKDLLALRKHASHLPEDVRFDVEMRLGAVLSKHGRHADAARAYDEALAVQLDSANAMLRRLLAAESLNDLSSAPMRELAAKLYGLCPEDQDTRRLAAAAGVELDAAPATGRAIHVRDAAAKNPSGWVMLVASGAAAAVLIGGVIGYRSWAVGPGIQAEAEFSPATSEAELHAMLDGAIPEAPDLKLVVAEDSTDGAPSEPMPQDAALSKPAEDAVADSDGSKSPDGEDADEHGARVAMADSRETADEAEVLEIASEDKPPASVPPEIVRRVARLRIGEIGQAFRKRSEEEGWLLSPDDNVRLSWRVYLLPYLGLEDLYKQFDLNAAWDSEQNLPLVEQMPEIYRLQTEQGATRFRVFPGDGLLVSPGKATYMNSISDGGSTTALVYVVGPNRQRVWTRPDTETMTQDEPHQALGVSAEAPLMLVTANGRLFEFPDGVHTRKLWALATAHGAERINHRLWFENGRAAQPPPRVFATLRRASGIAPTEKLVSLPRVRTPRVRSGSQGEKSDPVERRLQDIGLALRNYHSTHKCFPVPTRSEGRGPEGEPMLSWRVHLLPFLDQTPLYRKFNLSEPWDSPHNRELIALMPDVYRSSPRDQAQTRFLGLSGPHQFFEVGGGLNFARITDGADNTLAVVQASANDAVPWTKPVDLALDLERPSRAFRRARGPIYCLTASGQVLRLPNRAPDEVWAALATVNGREVLDGCAVRRYGEHSAGRALTDSTKLVDENSRRFKRIVIAMLNYQDSRKYLPANARSREANYPEPLLSWRVELLPYLEQSALYRQFRRNEPWDSEHNLKLLEFMPDIYRDADDSVNETNTRVVVLTGPQTPYERAAEKGRGLGRRQFGDGASQTILLIQADERRAVPWTKPADLEFFPQDLGKTFDRISPKFGLLAAMADGSVHAIRPGISLETLKALVTPNGGEVVADSWRTGGF